MTNEERFYNTIRQRSEENEKALKWLMHERLYSLVGSILRMELESLIRLTYYNYIASDNIKTNLLKQFFNGEKWQVENQNCKLVKLKEKDMLDATGYRLAWAEPIYLICCSFIHLSPFHDWATTEPTNTITTEDRKIIVHHVNEHVKYNLYKKYSGTMLTDFTFLDLVNIAEDVFCKLKDNLRCELEKR